MHCIKDALWSSSNAKMQQLTNHSQPLFFSKRIISHWDFCFVFSCLFFLAAGFAVFVATIFWIFVPIAGIGVQLLANSLSLIMTHSTTPSLSSAEPTRPGLQQRSLTNALVSISFNINLSKISLSLSQGQSVSTHQSLMQLKRWLSPGTPTILQLTTRRLPTSAMLDNLTTGIHECLHGYLFFIWCIHTIS